MVTAELPRVRVALLAGGRGTRFWPLSTTKVPKQFLSLFTDGKTMLQETWSRVQELTEQSPLIVTGAEYCTLSASQLPNAEVLAEPVGRNTAASIGWASQHCLEDTDILIVLPSDHLIKNNPQFQKLLLDAVQLAYEKQAIVTMGIVPTAPHTGYGYIQRGEVCQYSGESLAFSANGFREKPDAATAMQYLSSGEFFWNSGMFVFPPKVMLEELSQFESKLVQGLKIFLEAHEENKRRSFESLPATSIDYAVMERSKRVYCLPCDNLGWSDIGAWDAWGAELEADPSGNCVQVQKVKAVDSTNCIVRAPNKSVALLGVSDLIVVEADNRLLICDKKRSQDIKIFADDSSD